MLHARPIIPDTVVPISCIGLESAPDQSIAMILIMTLEDAPDIR
jgi:hypothetical protein